MKNKFIFLLFLLLTHSTFAQEGDWYIKLKLGRLDTAKMAGMTSKAVIFPGVALGYNIRDNMRVDLSISHISNMKHSKTVVRPTPVIHALPPAYGAPACCGGRPVFLPVDVTEHATSSITTGKINVFIDVLKIHNTSFFIGGGVGVSRHSGSLIVDDHVQKFKPSYTLAYDIQTGITQKLQNSVYGEVGYTYKNLTEHGYRFHGHTMTAGIRIHL